MFMPCTCASVSAAGECLPSKHALEALRCQLCLGADFLFGEGINLDSTLRVHEPAWGQTIVEEDQFLIVNLLVSD